MTDTPQTTTDIVVQNPGEIVQTEGAAILTAILELSRDKDFDVEKLRALTSLQMEVEARAAQRQFNAAFTRMQGKIPTVKRDGSLEYPIHKDQPDGPKRLISKYARWEDIERAIQPILAEHGFALSFKITPRPDGGGLMVSSMLRHEGGHVEIGDPFPVPLDTSGGKNNIQAYGSALSYGQRYAAKAAGLIRTEGDDDDGVAAGGSPITPDEAAQIKKLVDEADIAEGETDKAKRQEKISRWFGDMLNYELPKGYASIHQEDGTRVRRALLSVKAKKLTSKEAELKI